MDKITSKHIDILENMIENKDKEINRLLEENKLIESLTVVIERFEKKVADLNQKLYDSEITYKFLKDKYEEPFKLLKGGDKI